MHGCMLDLCTCMKVYNNNVETRRMIDVYTQLHSSYVHEWMAITHCNQSLWCLFLQSQGKLHITVISCFVINEFESKYVS